VICFIHRLERIEGLDKHDKLGVDPAGIADFIIAKQRDGPIGTVYLQFIKEHTRFESINIEQEYEDAETGGADSFGDGSLIGATMPGWTQRVIGEDKNSNENGNAKSDDTQSDEGTKDAADQPLSGDGHSDDPPDIEPGGMDEDPTLPI